jgi:hypothetical protein
MKPVKNNDTINMHNDDLPPLPRKTAWSIIRDAMVQAARIERGGYSNEERSARFDAVAAQAEKAIQALPAVAASGSPAEVPPTDTERLNWLERFILDNKTDGHLFCYAGDLTCPTDECYLEVDGEAVGQAPTIREAIDAAMQSAAVWRSAQQ